MDIDRERIVKNSQALKHLHVGQNFPSRKTPFLQVVVQFSSFEVLHLAVKKRNRVTNQQMRNVTLKYPL